MVETKGVKIMSRRGENIRKRKDGRWEGRYIKGYDSKKQKARYASVYGKTYAETKQKLDEAKYKSILYVRRTVQRIAH